MLDAVMETYAALHFLAETLVFQPRSALESPPPQGDRCPDAPWRLPTESDLGLWWYTKALGFMDAGYQNTVPVHAVADGLLTRREAWNDAVAIQHDDPLHPGKKVWTFYGGMADADNEASFVADAFPPGSEGVPVKAGDLLGYQGRWWQGPIWVHVHFAITPARADGSFPAALVNRADASDEPLPYELEKTMTNRNDVDIEAKDKPSVQAATLGLWLATAVLGFLALPKALNILLRIYAGFWGDYGLYGRTYSTAVALRQFLVLPLAMIVIAVIIGGAEYHYRHIGEPRSWRLFAQTLGAELAIFLMAMFI